MKRTHLLTCALALAAPFGVADAAAAKTVKGTVIQRSAKSEIVALKSGKLLRVRGVSAKLGSVLVMHGKKSGGAFAAKSSRVVAHSSRAKIHGVVVTRSGSGFELADNGPTVPVVSTTPPPTGTTVTTVVNIAGSTLDEDENETQVDPAQAATVDFEGRIAALPAAAPAAPVLQLLAHHLPVNVAIGTVPLPAGLTVGQEVEVTATVAKDATTGAITLTLASIKLEEGEDQGSQGNSEHGNRVKAAGAVKTLTATLLEVTQSDGTVVAFTIPAGSTITGIKVGDLVEAKGTVDATTKLNTLTRLELAGQGHGGDDGDHKDGHHGDDDNTSVTPSTTPVTPTTPTPGA